MSLVPTTGSEIVPGYKLVRRLGAGMAGEVWVARASGGVQVAIKIIRDLDMLGSQRELGALRVVREVKHPNLCPLFGVWFFDRDGHQLSATETDEILYQESDVRETIGLPKFADAPLKPDISASDTDTHDSRGIETEAFGMRPLDAPHQPAEQTQQTPKPDEQTGVPADFDSPNSDASKTGSVGHPNSDFIDSNESHSGVSSPGDFDNTPSDSATTTQVFGAKKTRAAQMVLAMGLGEKTLHDRLVEVKALRSHEAGTTQADHTTSQATGSQATGDANSANAGIDPNELIRYIRSAASAIDELNIRYNIYHCDIKPQNILIVGGQAQVCDFGLARQVEDTRQTQMAFGTPAYGAPEMLFDRTYSKTIDQYSLAVTYYELRSGDLPYSGLTHSSFLKAKATGRLDLSFVSPAEQKVLARATDLDSEKRYDSCQAFVDAIEAAVNKTPESPTGKLPKIAMAIGLAAVIAGLMFFALRPNREPSLAANVDSEKSTTLETPKADSLKKPQTTSPDVSSVSPEVKPIDPEDAALDGIKPKQPTDQPKAESSDTTEETPSAISNMTKSKSPSETLPKQIPLDPASQLRAIAASSKSSAEQFADQSVVLEQLVSSNNPQLDQKTLKSLVQDVASASRTLFRKWVLDETISEQTFADLKKICRFVAPMLDKQNSSADAKPFTLAQLQLALMDSETPEEDVTSYTTSLHEGLDSLSSNKQLQSDAAVALAFAHERQFDDLDNNLSQIHTDLHRASDLSEDDSTYNQAITHLFDDFLEAILAYRPSVKELQKLDVAMIEAIKRVQQNSSRSTFASIASWLLDPKPEGTGLYLSLEKRKPLSEKVIAETPETVKTACQIAAGWAAWHESEPSKAFKYWRAATSDPKLASSLHADDRMLAAEHFLDWIIDYSQVTDDRIDVDRYETIATTALNVFSVVDKLGRENQSFSKRMDAERVLWHVAKNDFQTANDYWQSINGDESSWDKIRTPQMARAVYRLSMHQYENDNNQTSAFNDLLAAAKIQSDADNANADELLVRCFFPAMDFLRPRTRSSVADSPVVPNDLDKEVVVDFCDAHFRLASRPQCRKLAGDVVGWLEGVEVAAAIYGANTKQPSDRMDAFASAFDAFLQSRYEQQDDVPIAKVVARLKDYYQKAIKFGTSNRTDFLHGRILDQEGFMATDRTLADQKNHEAIAQYDRVISNATKDEEQLVGVALRCRAAAKTRIAVVNQQFDLLDEAVNDARRAIESPEFWHADADDRLETFAVICRHQAHFKDADESLTDQNKFLDDARASFDDAIQLRKVEGLAYTHLALRNIDLLWIDLQVNQKVNPTRFQQTLTIAKKKLEELAGGPVMGVGQIPQPIKARADSAQLQALWHFHVATILELEKKQTGFVFARPKVV